MSQIKQSSAYDVLKIPDFRNYIIARTFMTLGFNMLATVVAWQVFEIVFKQSGEKSANYALGLIGLSEFIPFIIVTLIGGYVADVLDRKKIVKTGIFFYILSALSLFYLSTKGHYLIEQWGVLPIYGIIACTGLMRGFLGPAHSAYQAQLIPKELFGNAATWSTMSWHIGSVGGPAIGGLIYGVTHSPSIVYVIVAGLELACLLLFFFMKTPSSRPSNEQPKEGLFKSVQSGLQFVFRNPMLLGALSLDMFAVLFGGAVAMLPSFAKLILQAGPEGLGFLRAAPAIGAIIMAAILAHYPITKHAGKILLASVAGFGICTLFFAFSTNFYFSLLMLAGTGFFDDASMVIRGTIVQLFTPDEMRGRVSSVNSLFIGSSNELGAFESGFAAKHMGLVPSVVFGGMMTLLVVVITWFTAPKMKDLDL
jgi:MFS family permease